MLILVFTILYISISKLYLPKIKDNLDNRESKIKEDLENANKFKEQSEAKAKEYSVILENAKKEISKMHYDSKTILEKGDDCTHDIPWRKKNTSNFYEGYYDFHNGMARFPKLKCAIAKKNISKQWDEIKQNRIHYK